MKRILLLSVLLFAAVYASAQLPLYQKRGIKERPNTGKYYLLGDGKKAEELTEKHALINKQLNTMQGFRILVATLSGNGSQTKAQELKRKLQADYPDQSVYVDFDEPNFKVMVGDYRTRLEAFAFFVKLRDFYPGSIVKAQVYMFPYSSEGNVPESDDEL